jgi:hypothetical protein
MEKCKPASSTERFREGTESIKSCRDTAMMTSEYKQDQVNRFPPARGEPEAEMAEHIFAQLRSSYDRLLDEPLPAHLQRLLKELESREKDS